MKRRENTKKNLRLFPWKKKFTNFCHGKKNYDFFPWNERYNVYFSEVETEYSVKSGRGLSKKLAQNEVIYLS